MSIFFACTPSLHDGVLPGDTIIRQGVRPHPGPRTIAENLEAEVRRNVKRRLEDEENKEDKRKKEQCQVEDVAQSEDKAEGMQWVRGGPLQASSYLTPPLAGGLQQQQQQQQKQQEEQRKRSFGDGRDCEEDDGEMTTMRMMIMTNGGMPQI